MTADELHDVQDWVQCSCCGKSIADTAEDNLDFATRGQDTGYGNCRECFGDPTAPPVTITQDATGKKQWPSEADVKRRLGWAGTMFYEARFDTLRQSLSPENLAKFEACPYAKKVLIVGSLVEKGVMI